MDDFSHNSPAPIEKFLSSATIQENLAHFVFEAEARVRAMEIERGYQGPVEPIALLSELSRLDYEQVGASPSWTPSCVYADMLGDMLADAVIYIGHACDYRGIAFLNALESSLGLPPGGLIFYDTRISESVAAPVGQNVAHLARFLKIGSEAAGIIDDLGYMTLSEASIAAALRQLRVFAEDIGVDTETHYMNAASTWLSMRSDDPFAVNIHVLCPRR